MEQHLTKLSPFLAVCHNVRGFGRNENGEKIVKIVHIDASIAAKDETAGPWGLIRWMANESLSSSSVAVARLIIRKGHSGEPHVHSNADEVIYLIRGKIRVDAEGEEATLQQGDALTIPAGLVHRIENIGNEDSEMTLSYSSGRREYEAK